MDLADELKNFDFNLEPELIAVFPAKERDESRLMVVNRINGEIVILEKFRDINQYFQAGDLLVTNHTKVSNRRVYLHDRENRTFEAVFLSKSGKCQWHCLIKHAGKLREGDILFANDEAIKFTFTRDGDDIRLNSEIEINDDIFSTIGTIPIPPYFKRQANEEDAVRYQTVFARESGSVAAPTAGLHFTEKLLQELKGKGVERCSLNLEIGYGTFRPINEDQWQRKKLHEEVWNVPEETAKLLNIQKQKNGKIISVGTTTLRTLETIYDSRKKEFRFGSGKTDIFITPDDTIHSCDALVTNFHLPKSSLLLLVAAFAGKDLIMAAYRKAIENKMRFYSYGDAMLII